MLQGDKNIKLTLMKTISMITNQFSKSTVYTRGTHIAICPSVNQFEHMRQI